MNGRTGFKDPAGSYNDGRYKGEFKRLYMPPNVFYGASLLRWKATSNLTATLELGGNLDAGFNEASWPQQVPLNKPPVYPSLPGQLSAGDWVRDYPNNSLDPVKAQIETLINGRALMTLPISDYHAAEGSEHIAWFGHFLVISYGLFGSDPNTAWYLDLVYIGEANAPACSS